ncbi:MAG: hypothetical protein ACR2IF_16525 [Terriglobales bacterium]
MLLGESPLTFAALTSALTEHFPYHATPADQMAFLRRALERLGTSLGYRVTPPHLERPHSDPCLDLVWWEPGRGTVLAADCDWGNAGEVAAAFTQLMTLKAPMKLLIFRTRHAGSERQDITLRTDIAAVLRAVGAAVVDFSQHLQGELYLLAELVPQQRIFRAYEFVVPVNGRLALSFEEAARVFRQQEEMVTR